MPFINCSTPQVDAITLSLAGNPADTLPANATNVTYTVASGGGSITGDLYSNPNPVTGLNTVEIERCYDAPIAGDCTPSYTQSLVSSNGTTATVSVTNTGSDPLLIGGTTTVNPGSTGTLSGVTVTTTASGSKQACFNVSCTSTTLQSFCETDTCDVDVQSPTGKNITLDCPTDPITNPNQPFTLNFTDNNPPVAPDTRNYDLYINDIDTGASIAAPASSHTSDENISFYTSGSTGTFTVELRCFDNGDTTNIIVAATCTVEFDYPIALHDNGLTFSEIETLSEPSHCFLDGSEYEVTTLGQDPDEYYVAEFLYQNQGVCYWEVQNINGVMCVVALPTPTPPANCIDLPAPSGGNDTAALEAVINSNSGASFCGTGGTYRLDDLDINVPAEIFDVPSVPNTNTTNTVWSINSPDVRIYNSPMDGQNSSGFENGWHVVDGSHRFHLVNSGLRNIRVTDSGSASAVRLRSVNDFHIACNTFENIINASGTGSTARANAIWHADANGFTSGGYIVNNTAINFQSNGNLKDAEFYTKQNFSPLQVGAYTRLFANRGLNAGKRFMKFQSGKALALSNESVWDVKAGNTGMPARTLLAHYAVIGDGSGPANDTTVRNNRITTEPGTLGQMDRIFSLGNNINGSVSLEDMHVDCNCITINSNDGGAVSQNPSIFYMLSGGFNNSPPGGYPSFQRSTINDNVAKGAGGIEHHWDFTTNGLPSTGWPAANLEFTGNNLSVPWTVAEFE